MLINNGINATIIIKLMLLVAQWFMSENKVSSTPKIEDTKL